ncbi:hypothetical protein Q8004_12430 [Edwardsiella piscicida]|nr:hypothetical protein Q8004_12430 [Edwardsiella piscicida]
MVFVCYHDSVQPDAQKQGMTAAAAGYAGVCLCSPVVRTPDSGRRSAADRL